eukprot:gene30750-35786_t
MYNNWSGFSIGFNVQHGSRCSTLIPMYNLDPGLATLDSDVPTPAPGFRHWIEYLPGSRCRNGLEHWIQMYNTGSE